MGSIDPYQVFRIFHEILFFEWETGARADIAYMIDQSHNLKGKIEAMIQTVDMAQELFSKGGTGRSCSGWPRRRKQSDLVRAESCLQDAFATDVRPAIREWRAVERTARRTRWKRFERADIWSASRASAPHETCPAFPLMRDAHERRLSGH